MTSLWQEGDALSPTNLNTKIQSVITTSITTVVVPSVNTTNGIYSVADYGADGTGVADSTTAFQNALNDSVTNLGTMYIPPGTYNCGAIVDTTSSRLQIMSSGGTVQSTASVWLRVQPQSGGKFGVVLQNLRLTPKSGNQFASPLVLLKGSAASGGVVEIDINNIRFTSNDSAFDCMHLIGCFNGRVANIYGDSLSSSRGIVYHAAGINSGNIHFDSVELNNAQIALQIGKSVDSNTNQNLLNQVIATNYKAVRGAGEAFNWVTSTDTVFASRSTVSLAAADVTSISTGDWLILDNINFFDDAYRVTSKLSSTMIQVDRSFVNSVGSGTTLAVGNFGVIIGGNAKGIRLDTLHTERVGAGVYCSGAQQVQVLNPTLGANVRRGVVCNNGSQNVLLLNPIFSLSESTKIIMEIMPAGNSFYNLLYEPAGFASGSGPGSYFSNGSPTTSQNGMFRAFSQISAGGDIWSGGTIYSSGLSVSNFSGAAAFTSRTFLTANHIESSSSTADTGSIILDLHTLNSAQSCGMGLAFSGRNVGFTPVEYGRISPIIFSSDTSTESSFLGIHVRKAGTITEAVRIQTDGMLSAVNDGIAANPMIGFNSERSLGLYRSANSNLALSYGTLNLRGAALSLRTTNSAGSSSALTNGEICLVAVSTTSAQIAWRSGNTTYLFNAVVASP